MPSNDTPKYPVASLPNPKVGEEVLCHNPIVLNGAPGEPRRTLTNVRGKIVKVFSPDVVRLLVSDENKVPFEINVSSFSLTRAKSPEKEVEGLSP